MILKWILINLVWKAWTGIIWIRIGASGPYEDINEFWDPIKIREDSGLPEKQLAAEEGL